MTAAVGRLSDHMAAARSRQGNLCAAEQECPLTATSTESAPLTTAAAEDHAASSPSSPYAAASDSSRRGGGRALLRNAERHSALARVRERRAGRLSEEVPFLSQPPEPPQAHSSKLPGCEDPASLRPFLPPSGRKRTMSGGDSPRRLVSSGGGGNSPRRVASGSNSSDQMPLPRGDDLKLSRPSGPPPGSRRVPGSGGDSPRAAILGTECRVPTRPFASRGAASSGDSPSLALLPGSELPMPLQPPSAQPGRRRPSLAHGDPPSPVAGREFKPLHEVITHELEEEAGTSASSTAPSPPVPPQKATASGPGVVLPVCLRPSRPPHSSQGRSVVAALRRVREDEAKRSRRVADVQAEGKRRNLLEEKEPDEGSGVSSPSSSVSELKESPTGCSSPSGAPQSPARLMLQRRLEMRREVHLAESSAPLEPPVPPDALERPRSPARGPPSPSLLSWPPRFFDLITEDNADQGFEEPRRQVSWLSDHGVCSEATYSETAGEEVVKPAAPCRHSSCSDREGQDCAISMASTASTFRPSSSPPPDAMSGCDEGCPDDEWEAAAPAATATSDHRASPAEFPKPPPQMRLAEQVGESRGQVAQKMQLQDSQHEDCAPDRTAEPRSSNGTSGTPNLSEQEEAALVVLRKRQAARSAARGQVVTLDQPQAGKAEIVDASVRPDPLFCPVESERNENGMVQSALQQAIDAEFFSPSEDRCTCLPTADRKGSDGFTPSLRLDFTGTREQLAASPPMGSNPAVGSTTHSHGFADVEGNRPAYNCFFNVPPEEEETLEHYFRLQSSTRSNSDFLAGDATGSQKVNTTNLVGLPKDLDIADEFMQPTVGSDDSYQYEACPMQTHEVRCGREAAAHTRNTLISPHTAAGLLFESLLPSMQPDDAGEQHLQACTSSDPVAADDPARPSRPTTRRGSRDRLNSSRSGDSPSPDVIALADIWGDDERHSSPSGDGAIAMLWQAPGADDGKCCYAPRAAATFNTCDYSMPPCDAATALGFSNGATLLRPQCDPARSQCDAATALGFCDDLDLDDYGLDSSGDDSFMSFCVDPPGELELSEQSLADRDLYVIEENVEGNESLRSSAASSESGSFLDTSSFIRRDPCAEEDVSPMAAVSVDRLLESEAALIASELMELVIDRQPESTILLSTSPLPVHSWSEQAESHDDLAERPCDCTPEVAVPVDAASADPAQDQCSSSVGSTGSQQILTEHHNKLAELTDDTLSGSDRPCRSEAVEDVAASESHAAVKQVFAACSLDVEGETSLPQVGPCWTMPASESVKAESEFVALPEAPSPAFGALVLSPDILKAAHEDALLPDADEFGWAPSLALLEAAVDKGATWPEFTKQSQPGTGSGMKSPVSSRYYGSQAEKLRYAATADSWEPYLACQASPLFNKELAASQYTGKGTATLLWIGTETFPKQMESSAIDCSAQLAEPQVITNADWEAPRVYAIAIEEDAEWKAAVRIQGAYRAHSFRKRCQQRVKRLRTLPVKLSADSAEDAHQARQATVVSAARGLAVLRSQVQREKEWAAALRVQTCWRGHSVRRRFASDLELLRTTRCTTRGSESARSRGNSRHAGQRSCKDVEQPAVEVGPVLSIEEARRLARWRVKNTRGSETNQQPLEQKAPAASVTSSSVRRHTVSELLEQEAAYRASLPKLTGPGSSSQRPVHSQVSRSVSREKRSTSTPPASDAPAGQQQGIPGNRALGRSDHRQRSLGSSDRGLGRGEASRGGAKKLPKAVTPRSTMACSAPRADAGTTRLRTPRAVGAGMGITELGSGHSASSQRSWG